MKIAIAAIVALIVGFLAGDFLGQSAAKPPATATVVENTALMNLTNTIEMGRAREEGLTNQIKTLSADLTDAIERIKKLAPEAAQAMRVPVKISKRKAMLGGGWVYQFQNLSGKPLRFEITFANGSSTKSYNKVFDSVLIQEIGPQEGWGGTAGDSVKVECAGYDAVTATF